MFSETRRRLDEIQSAIEDVDMDTYHLIEEKLDREFAKLRIFITAEIQIIKDKIDSEMHMLRQNQLAFFGEKLDKHDAQIDETRTSLRRVQKDINLIHEESIQRGTRTASATD